MYKGICCWADGHFGRVVYIREEFLLAFSKTCSLIYYTPDIVLIWLKSS